MYSPELQELVEQELNAGKFQSADELLLSAVRLYQRCRELSELELRAGIKEGFDQLARGEGFELDDGTLRTFFDEIEGEVDAEMAAKD